MVGRETDSKGGKEREDGTAGGERGGREMSTVRLGAGEPPIMHFKSGHSDAMQRM